MELNKRQKNKIFEKEVFEFLKTKFEKVNWLSENKITAFDYECYKDGKKYNIDAKTQVHLEESQKDIDFIVRKIDGKLKLLSKGEIDEIIKKRMERAGFDDGLLRLKIIEITRESEYGLTIGKIEKILNIPRYKIQLEIGKLIGIGELEMVQIGNYQVVRVK